MEYYKNLYPHLVRRKLQLILGIIFIALSISWILIKMNDEIIVFDWIYSAIFFLNGVNAIMQYYGYIIEEFFGKRFIRITDEKIQYKPKTFKPETTILWENITSIQFKVNKIEFKCNDGKTLNLQYSSMEYSSVQKLKDAISEIAKNYKITNN